MRSFAVVKSLVMDNAGKALTLRRSQTDTRRPGQWDLPGGWLEEGDVLATAERECLEEANIRISAPKIVYGMTVTTREGDSCTLIFVLARAEGNPDVVLSYEHDAYQWLSLDDLLAAITYDRHVEMLRYVRDNGLLDS